MRLTQALNAIKNSVTVSTRNKAASALGRQISKVNSTLEVPTTSHTSVREFSTSSAFTLPPPATPTDFVSSKITTTSPILAAIRGDLNKFALGEINPETQYSSALVKNDDGDLPSQPINKSPFSSKNQDATQPAQDNIPSNNSSSHRHILRRSSAPELTMHKHNHTDGVDKIMLVGRAFSTEKLLYAQALQKTADKYGVVIGLRTPSELGQIHLQEGHPTKNFHVKAKSSVNGPTAGFIPEKALYSKVGSQGQATHDANIKKALAAGAKLVALKLSETQIAQAIKKGVMDKIGPSTYKAVYDGIEQTFTINKFDHIVRDENEDPIKVLTNPPEKSGDSTPVNDKPITADYDLFAIIPKENQSVNQLPIKIGHNLVTTPTYLEPAELKGKQNDFPLKEGEQSFKAALNAFTQSQSIDEQDPDKGNVHTFGKVIIDDINQNAAQEYQGGKLVWHGDESANPYSAGFDPNDNPIFFIPGQPPQQISSKKELLAFYRELKNAGFAPDNSPKLGIS